MNTEPVLPISLYALEVEYFRLFKSLNITFHPELTVIVAPNSGGKSTILDAIHSLLIPIVYDNTLPYKESDKHHDSVGSYVFASLKIQKKYFQSLASKKNQTLLLNEDEILKIRDHTTWYIPSDIPDSSLEFVKFGGGLKRKYLKANNNFITVFQMLSDVFSSRELKTLPLFSYFTANRRSDSPTKGIKVGSDISSFSRLDAYKSLLSDKHNVNLTTFTSWLRERELTGLEEQLQMVQENEQGIPTPSSHLIAVSNVLSLMLEKEIGIKAVKYFAKSKKVQAVTTNGDRLDIDQLSHGAKSALIIAGELAMHACALNPHLKEHAPAQTPGIVLIDEIDLHLHPKWQQHIIYDLRRCFPLMQFIITTHSPQILSTVKRENIRVIGENIEGEMVASEPLAHSYGEPSGDVMHSIMQVDPQPPVPEKKQLDQLTELVDQGLYANDNYTARIDDLRRILIKALGENHPQLKKIERSIRRQKVLGK